MTAVLGALLPLFALIAAGYGARRIGWPGPAAWRAVERLTYYVLFPALLFQSLSTTSLAGGGAVAIALALATLVIAAAAVTIPTAMALDGATLSSVLQGAIRPNTYVGVGAALAVWGDTGVALAAVGLAVVIPMVNVISVVGLLRYAPSSSAKRPSVVGSLARNPLILSCLAGLAINGVGVSLPGWLSGPLKLIGQASLPLGLLAVGAALELTALRARFPAIAAACALKLLVSPAVAALMLAGFGVGGVSFAVAVVYMGVPTSASAYVLAAEMGGDRDVIATIISATTVLSALTLPLIVMLVR
ncbi:MAG: AEC family transporter [Gemmatimonas sp.]